MPDEHLKQANEKISPKTAGCEEHEQQGRRDWISLNLCLTCGHVGCCDSSPGRHATGHFRKTGHPIILRLPLPGAWKWCYAHKLYV